MPRPHYLEAQRPATPDSFSDDLVKPGEVIDVIYPEDARSIGKKLIEYMVEVQFLDRTTGTGRARIYRATLSNHLGSAVERERFVLRSDTPDRETGIGRGSKVVVCNLNAEHNAAIILGGLRDTEVDNDLGLKDSGTLYERDINGLKLRVGVDGVVRWSRSGPRGKDGKTTDEPKQIGSLTMEKDGSTLLGLGKDASSDPSQYMRLDASDGKAKIVADNGLHVGEATDKFPLFSTYRTEEASMHSQLQAQLILAQTAFSVASTAMAAAAVLLILPIVGPILAAPAIGQLSAQLGIAAATMGSIQSAISAFEAKSEAFLSRRNRND